MSANLTEITVSGSTFPNVLALPKSQNIGGIHVQTGIREEHTSKLSVTDHPIEKGADVTDHSFVQPTRVVLECGWSNSSSILSSLLSGNFDSGSLGAIAGGLFSGGTMSASDYVSGIWSKLQKMQQARGLVTIQTGLVTYKNMLIEECRCYRDKTTSFSLMATITCRQINVVSTSSTTVPDQSSQGTPSSTAAVQQTGTVSPVAATPAMGGSFTVGVPAP